MHDKLDMVNSTITRAKSLTKSKYTGLLICGDFNDWTGKAGNLLEQELNIKEAFKELNGSYAKTFPVRNPFLTLDRIYFRHLVVESAECFYKDEWKNRSDHAALCANFKIIF